MSEESWRRTADGPPSDNDHSWARRAGSNNSSNNNNNVDESTGGSWRQQPTSTSDRAERPKLNLTKRGEAATAGTGTATINEKDGQTKDGETRPKQPPQPRNNNGGGERRFREPEVVNSRAAMLGDVNAPRKEVRHGVSVTIHMCIYIVRRLCYHEHSSLDIVCMTCVALVDFVIYPLCENIVTVNVVFDCRL